MSRSFEDIYRLKDHEDEMKNLDGFGEKSVNKLLKSIEKSIDTTLDKFIYSLSIPLIGRSASKTIASHWNNDVDNFLLDFKYGYDYTVLNDFGNAMSDSMNEFSKKHIEEVISLSGWVNCKRTEVSNNNTLNGKTFVITGSLNHFANRDEAVSKIEAAGGKVSGSVSAKTSYLVNNDAESTSGKNKKAKELNVPIISEEELISMLNK